MIYADIIVDISHEKLDRSFQYRVPKELEAEIQLGMVVTIPFGNGNHERKGYVTGLSDKPAFDISKMKELHGICSSEETTEERLIALAAWMKNRYGSTMVQALKTVLPVREKVKAKEKRYIVLNMDVAAAEQLEAELESGRCKARARLVRALLKEKKLDYTKASRELGMTAAVIRPLVDQGAVLVTQDEVYRMPVDGSDIPREQLSMLTETQEAALLQIQEEWKQETPRPVLIHGVTGSGKTQIYMKTALLRFTTSNRLQAIGTGSSVRMNDTEKELFGTGEEVVDGGNAVTYASDADYMLMNEIPLTAKTMWTLPEGFTGTFAEAPK